MTADTPADPFSDPFADTPESIVERLAKQDSYGHGGWLGCPHDLSVFNEAADVIRALLLASQTIAEQEAKQEELRTEVERLTAERDALAESKEEAIRSLNSSLGQATDLWQAREAECVTLRQALAEIVGHAYNLMTQGESPTQLRQPSVQRIYDTARAVLAASSTEKKP